MDSSLATTRSVWTQAPAAEIGTDPPLTADAACDVCVIGAGITGLSIAYHLARAGRRVVVLDGGAVASGQTARTTAHLSNALDDRYAALERWHGEAGARLAADSHSRAIDTIEATAAREGVDCDFRRLEGYLFAAPGTPLERLDEEAAAARRAGLAVERVAKLAPGTTSLGPALRFPDQGQFHPLKYLAGLARAIRRMGSAIHPHSRAKAAAGGAAPQVEVEGGYVVRAGAVAVATNTPFVDRLSIHTKQAAYRTYVVAARLAADSVPPALYWDTADPYHYVRTWREGDHTLLLVGGEDHKTGQADPGQDRFERLEAWARTRFPIGAVTHRWSGQVMKTVDGLGYIGRNPGGADHLYVATGDSGMGMTHGTIAGLLLADLILGRSNPWTALYDPARRRVRAAGTFVRENLNVLAQYAERLTAGGEVEDAAAIAPGAGAVMRRGLTRLAVYRDADGVLHERSAVCPHLGCIVAWNGLENSWDCPCHGSRFDAFGAMLSGPAATDLAPASG